MARGKGYQGIVGLNKGTTWGTAVAAGAGDGIIVTSLEAIGNRALVDNNRIKGSTQPGPKFAGNMAVNVTVRSVLTYEGFETLLAMVMGTAGTPSTVDTSAKQHVLKVNSSIDDIFATLAYEIVKDTTVVEIPSVMFTGFTIRGRSGQPIEVEFRGFGDDYKYGTSTTNTTTTIDTVTSTANEEVALWKHAKLLMNAQDGADFTDTDAGDRIPVIGFELMFDRPYEAVFSTGRGDGLSALPRPTGFLNVSGSFDYPDLDSAKNAGFVSAQPTLTAQKAKLVLTGQTLAGAATQYFQHNYWLPYIQLGDGKPTIPGPEGIQWSQSWESKAVSTIPTGFTTGYTDSLTVDIFSQRSTDALA